MWISQTEISKQSQSLTSVQCGRPPCKKTDRICLAKACCCFCRQMEMKKDHKDEPEQEQLEEMPGTLPHFSLAILLLYGMNTGLSKLTHALDIQFPSALIGNPLTLPCVTGPTPCRHKRFAMSRRALQAENLCPLAGSNNACVMRSVHCGSHAHSIALTQMFAFVQPEAIAGQPGLQRYCVQPWQASCVLIGAPHASALAWSSLPKPSGTMLSCWCLQPPVSHYHNGAMQCCHL